MPKGVPDKGFQLTRERQAILDILKQHGPIEDPNGRATAALQRYTGHEKQNSLSAVLKAMERVGLIKRHIEGRRTLRIELADSGVSEIEEALAPPSTPTPIETVEEVETEESPGRVDLDALAAILIRRAAQSLDAPSHLAQIKELTADLYHAQTKLETTQSELKLATEQRDVLADQLTAANKTIAALNDQIQRAQRKTRSTTAVRDLVDGETKEQLERLMKQLPTTRGD